MSNASATPKNKQLTDNLSAKKSQELSSVFFRRWVATLSEFTLKTGRRVDLIAHSCG